MLNLFGPLSNLSEYCWVFKLGAIVNFFLFIFSLIMIIRRIFTFKSKTQVGRMTYIILAAIGYIFSYYLWRVLYTMCVSSSGGSTGAKNATMAGISGYYS